VRTLQAGTNPGYLSIFQKANQSLEQIQKELSDYLSMKRAAFARFYFLGDDELLEILAQSKNPQAVQPHMSKCFDGIKMLEFGDEPSKSTSITAMVSAEGERVPLGGNLKARGGVEVWLASVELEMQRSLARAAKEGLKSYELKERTEWILEQPAQLVIVVSQIFWALDVVKALHVKGTAMHEYHQVCCRFAQTSATYDSVVAAQKWQPSWQSDFKQNLSSVCSDCCSS
jgi:dynein heavy chain, axonemal